MRRMVVVDDEIEIAKALQRLFRGRYDVRTAASGSECLRVLEDFVPDAVLTDFRMPGMTGLELLAEVRRRHPHVVGVLITGYADLQDPGVPMIAKPWDRKQLVALLDALFDKAGAA